MSSSEDLSRAVAALRQGLVIAIPTDTVYGIAVDPSVPGATRRLFDVKQRPTDVRLPVLVADAAQAETVVDIDARARRLMDEFWPGGLTIVLRRRSGVDIDVGNGAGVPTIGVRCPGHPVPLRLCAEVGALATTSANLHGGATPPTADEVRDLFGSSLEVVIDGGRCDGEASTVIDASKATLSLIREGSVPWSEVLRVAG